ncbi:hypothetical protein ACCS63_35835, partial [Rhizobium brockwellii]
MFLSPNEQVSVANLLYGIVTLSGNDACVVLAEHIAGTEQNFTDRMNRTAKQIGQVTRGDIGHAAVRPAVRRTEMAVVQAD